MSFLSVVLLDRSKYNVSINNIIHEFDRQTKTLLAVNDFQIILYAGQLINCMVAG